MVLTAFVALQLVLDVALVILLLRRRPADAPAPPPPPSEEPPAWYGDFVMLAEDLLALVEPVLDVLEAGQLDPRRAVARTADVVAPAATVTAPGATAAPVRADVVADLRSAPDGRAAVAVPAARPPAPAPSRRDRQREAFGLLRAGEAPDEVARRVNLLPAEVQLISNLVAAEAEFASSRRS